MHAGGCFLVFGNDVPMPPLEGLTDYGCSSYPLLGRATYRATGWANYDDEHLEAVRQRHFSLEIEKQYPHRGWAHLISQRSGKKADDKSAADCVEWIREVRKVVEQNKKGETPK